MEYFGDEMIRNFVALNGTEDPETFNDTLIAEIDDFRGEQEFNDDIAVLTCKIFQIERQKISKIEIKTRVIKRIDDLTNLVTEKKLLREDKHVIPTLRKSLDNYFSKSYKRYIIITA